MTEQLRDNERFDASQYAFFGDNAGQDFELGGLDDEEDAATTADKNGRHLDVSDKNEKIEHVNDVYNKNDRPCDIAESMMKLGLDTVPKELDHEPSDWVRSNEKQQTRKAHANFLSLMLSSSGEFQLPTERPYPQPVHNNWSAVSHDNVLPFLPQVADLQSLPMPLHLHHVHPQPHQGQFIQPIHGFVQEQAARNNFQGMIERQIGIPRANIVDYELEFQQGNRETIRSGNNFHTNFTRAQLRSKYMSVEEIENIARIQLASAQANDAYSDDYYHLAAQAKHSGGSFPEKPQFLPPPRNSTTHRRQSSQRTFAPSNGLGRVSLSSPQRPRQLLEVDNCMQVVPANLSDRPLEQEPMLAARIAIEDGLCLLLDIDDIDRILIAAHLPDGGNQLRWQRQMMLEGLATSLHLVDPSNSMNNMYWRERNEKAIVNDIVFQHLVSLTKGRKLVYRYLQLLPQESQLVGIVCMAVFRHLRLLFGVPQRDMDAAAATTNLAQTVADCTLRMDLQTITSCLAAVLSSEPPPLRPFGSASGDGASLILRSALDRATHLLTDPRFMFSLKDRELWQAHFDDFFVLLYKYCTSKFDHILHSLAVSSSSARSKSINAAAAGTMSREMPIEILQASLPHMSEHQRMSLLDFTQRSMSMGTLTAAVPG